MAGSHPGAYSMLDKGQLPVPRPLPMGALQNESEHFQKERKAKQEAVALGYEEHGNQSRAIKDAGLDYQTFNRWIHQDAPFQERMLQAHQVWKEHLQDKLYQMVDTQADQDHPNPVPVIFALKGNWPEKYGDKIRVEDTRLDRLLEMTKRQGELEDRQRGEWIEGEARALPEAPGDEASSS